MSLLLFRMSDGFVVIPTYPNYMINRDGVVKNNKGEIKTWHGDRYLQCSMYNDKKMHTESQHRLLAQTFIPNPNNYPHVDHLNGNTKDNHLENLEWVSAQQNEFRKGLTARNTTGEKYISWYEARQTWRFAFKGQGHNIAIKRKNYDEILKVRDAFLATLE